MRDTWEAQVVVTKEVGPLEFGMGVQADILNRGKGAVGFAGVGYQTELTDRLRFSADFDVSFANAEHINTEVGISAATSGVTGLPAYTASGGYKGATLELGVAYALTDHAWVYVEGSVERYGAKMSDSPLIRDHGTATNNEIEIGVGFRF